MGWGAKTKEGMVREVSGESSAFGAKISINIGKVRKSIRAVGGQLQPVTQHVAGLAFEANAEADTPEAALRAALDEVREAINDGMGGSGISLALQPPA